MSRTAVPSTSSARAGTSHARLVRGGAAGAVATFIALFSHVAAGGPPPVLLGVVLPLVFAIFVSVVLAGRTLSLTRLSASVGLSQAAFHWIFDAASSAPTGVGRAQAAAAAALDPHAHHGVGGVPADFAAAVQSSAVQSSAASAGASAGHAAEHAHHHGPLMTLAHIAAAVVTIALLHHAEHVLASLARLLQMLRVFLAPLLRVLLPAVITTSRRSRLSPGCEVRTPVPLGVVRSTRLDRGPPVRVPALA